MKRKQLVIALLIASLAGNAAFLVTAFARAREQAPDALEQLALTAEQRDKFQAANRRFVSQRALTQQRFSELRGQLASEFLKEAPDRSRLLSVALEMAELQTARRPKLVDHLLLLHALLSPAQRTTMADQIRHSASTCCAACPGSSLFRKTAP